MTQGIFRKLFPGKFHEYLPIIKYFFPNGAWLRGFSGNFCQCLEKVSGKPPESYPKIVKIAFRKSFRKIPWVMPRKFAYMGRLKSEDFSNFLWCLDIIFLTYYYERTRKNVQKNHDFFLIFWNFRDFLPFFRGFLFSVFLHSNAQSRDSHQTILLEFLRRMYIVRSLRATERKWFYTKNRPKMWFYGG